MNTLTQDIVKVAAIRAGVNPDTVNPAFARALVELVAGHCADIADEGDVHMTYNIGGDICDAFGLTTA